MAHRRRLSDVNFIAAPEPDDERGYQGAPYTFRLVLTYHPGVSYPQSFPGGSEE